MPLTPTYGLPYEALSEQPGRTLHGGDPPASSPILAEEVEAELARVDGNVAAVNSRVDTVEAQTTDWAAYTPVITGAGTATFSTLDGYWRRIGKQTVAVRILFVVNVAGSGASPVEVSLPTAATGRQVFAMDVERQSDLGVGHGVVFTAGGSNINRLRAAIGSGNPGNLLGASLTSGTPATIITISGVYREQ